MNWSIQFLVLCIFIVCWDWIRCTKKVQVTSWQISHRCGLFSRTSTESMYWRFPKTAFPIRNIHFLSLFVQTFIFFQKLFFCFFSSFIISFNEFEVLFDFRFRSSLSRNNRVHEVIIIFYSQYTSRSVNKLNIFCFLFVLLRSNLVFELSVK